MKNEDGKSPLGWIITIVISLLIAGVVVAMIFADNEQVTNKIEEYKNKNNSVQTEKE